MTLPDPFSLPDDAGPRTPWSWRFRSAHHDYVLVEDLGNGVEGIAQRVYYTGGMWRASGLNVPTGLGLDNVPCAFATATGAMEWVTGSLIIAGWTETHPGEIALVHEPCWRVVQGGAVLVGRAHTAWLTEHWVDVVDHHGPRVSWTRAHYRDPIREAEEVLRELDTPAIKDN